MCKPMNDDRLVQLILACIAAVTAGCLNYLKLKVEGLIEDMDDLTRQVDYIIEYLEKERADDGK